MTNQSERVSWVNDQLVVSERVNLRLVIRVMEYNPTAVINGRL